MEIIKAKLISPNNTALSSTNDSYLEIANQFYLREKYDSVLVYLHKSHAENSDNWELYYLYGKTASKSRKFERANEYFFKALAINNASAPERAKIYFALGENEDLLGNAVKAKQHYIMVLQLHDGSKLADQAFNKMQKLSLSD